jgi:hypothetical protein
MKLSKELEEIIEGIKKYNEEGKNSTGFFTLIRNRSNILSEIISLTSFLDSKYGFPEIGQRVYHIKESLTQIPRCHCSLPLRFHRLNTGYFSTCGNKKCKDSVKVNTFRKTIKEKYGDSYFKEGSPAREKYKSTMSAKYGVDHNFKSKEIRDNIKNTLKEKYGEDSPLKNKKILEKRNLTCENRYGTLDFLNSDKARETNLDRYGFTNPMKNGDISRGVTESSSRTKRKQLEDKLGVYLMDLISYSTERCDVFCNRCNANSFLHSVTINAKLRSQIDPCSKCNPNLHNRSLLEEEMAGFIKDIYSGEIKCNDRSIFSGSPKFSECDVYLPEIQISFEFNGLYWHSEAYKDKKYHQEKSQFLLDKGIRLHHIWEDDWNYKKPIVKSMISSSIGKYERKIFARKCQISEVPKKEYKRFCEDNHLKGYCPASRVFGLYYEGELVSLMSFSKTRKLIESKNTFYDYELIRSCSKLNTLIVGGVSKIVKNFMRNSNGSLVTYCDISFSPDHTKTSYSKCGFGLVSKTDPGYYWVIDGRKSNRLNWTKKKLVSLGHDPKETGDYIMNSLGYYKIWDCGNYKFEMVPK